MFVIAIVATLEPATSLTLITVLLLAIAYATIIRPRLEELRRRRVEEQRQRDELQARLDRQITAADAMTGSEFEELVRRLLIRDGCTNVRVTGGPGDLGVDVEAIGPDGGLIVIQCKRYAQKAVGSADIQRFIGTVWQDPRQINAAVLVTTSRFTAPARELAQRTRIQLVDREMLVIWMDQGAQWSGFTRGED